MQLAVYECVGVSKATKQIGAFSIKKSNYNWFLHRRKNPIGASRSAFLLQFSNRRC